MKTATAAAERDSTRARPGDAPAAVLLSSYNGERFIGAQVDSILAQSHRNLRLIVRDDGSSDGTTAIVTRYAERHANVELRRGRNVGAVASFLELLDHAPEGHYVALSDQDDVWREDKVERAIAALQSIDGPAMYFSNVEIVGTGLEHLAAESDRAPRGASFANALVENIATGCTVVLNAAAAGTLRGRNVRHADLVMHDWWIYQVIAGIGNVIYERYAGVCYRQHPGNVVGSPSGLRRWSGRVKRHLGKAPARIRRQALELQRVYGSELPPNKKSLLAEFVRAMSGDALQRMRYALKAPVYRQRRLDDEIFKLLMVVGRV